MASDASRAFEAVVLVADEPVDPHLLAQLLEVSVARVDELFHELTAEYEREGRGFVLAKVAGGFRYQSHPDEAAYVERFALEGQSARLSAAALETLAIVAYKQPVSRAQVAAIRGVNVDGVMRTLQQRGYVDEVARDPGPGQAILYGTTNVFLEKLGLDSLHDLPSLASFIPGAEVVEALEVGLRVVDPSEAVTPDPSDPPEAVTPDPSEPSESPDLPEATSEALATDAASGGAAPDHGPDHSEPADTASSGSAQQPPTGPTGAR